ncbi:response regulator [Roseivirga sp. BDSF3-8]|uniref:response regulator n=1 Tax=Roseivirga sp. BDSF3-8 TaxID=3241598 RepID=UPI003531A6DC
MKKINVLIADDHQIVLDGLTLLLQNEEDIHIVDVVADGSLALKVMEYEKVDVAVIDISMPGLDGVETTKAIKEKYPETAVLILTMHNEGGYITELIKTGASGYILKNRGKEELVDAIHKVAAGGQFFSESVTQTLIADIKNGEAAKKKNNMIQLTRREKEVLKHISRGLTSPQIAEVLFIAPSTVETHRRNLIDKIGVPNSKGLVRYAIKNGYSD